ncbi:MAG TPA: polysaccharide deacetylase family protein [Alphaproteobacteria bacterium]|nr:polysaccharide deacetylase family protein [Alphaproteobacteria bacterium]
MRGVASIIRKGAGVVLAFATLLGGAASGFCADSAGGTGAPSDSASAVILSWRAGGEDDDGPGVDPADFEAQIREVTQGGYTALSISEVVSAVRAGHALPPLSVALTFDGGGEEIVKTFAPVLLRARIPFAVFFFSDKADARTPGYLGWDDLRTLAKNPLVSVGIHPATPESLAQAPAAEIARQINRARVRYREEMGAEPAFFSYPSGGVSAAYRAVVERQNFRGAFGGQSGATSPRSDPFLLPRFDVTNGYDDIERFRMVARALPMAVSNIFPEDPLLTENPPHIGFSLALGPGESFDRLACVSSGQGRPKIEIVGAQRVELRFAKSFDEAQARVTCTLPAGVSDQDGEVRWRWVEFLLAVPERLLP